MALTLDARRGRILGVDSHEPTLAPRWDEEFLERGRRLREQAIEMLARAAKRLPPHDPNLMTIDRSDETEISQERACPNQP